MADEHVEQIGSRWQYKSRTSQLGLLGSASSRNTRRSKRLPEMEVREEKELGLVEGIRKPRKRTTSRGLIKRRSYGCRSLQWVGRGNTQYGWAGNLKRVWVGLLQLLGSSQDCNKLKGWVNTD
ncbi:hypothetical protein TorRG33x02_108350 [Trema orientale]|uniref:Uncharacterized protein n=1 Tax=Trema orientale TaxID=63057 RepID=A0A2P5F653_TREOI|nr:hypothetical protein TorRG33x02_108350 [Trema orientale]